MAITTQFEFSAGSPSLCLVDTLGQRHKTPIERLRNSKELAGWFHLAGFHSVPQEKVSAKDLRQVLLLREAVYRCGLRIIEGLDLNMTDVDFINALASRPGFSTMLRGSSILFYAKRPLEAALSTLAADAISLFDFSMRDRIRLCPSCSMMFVDTSRPGRRRWCSSASRCGNRAKVRDHRARKAATSKKDLPNGR